LEELLEGFGLPGVAVREEDEGGARLGSGRGGGSREREEENESETVKWANYQSERCKYMITSLKKR